MPACQAHHSSSGFVLEQRDHQLFSRACSLLWLVKQTVEVRTVSRKASVKQIFEFLEPQIIVRLVDVPKIVVELAVSSVEVGSS